MRILVSGSHGLIGRAVVPALTKAGHETVPLTRSTGPLADSDPVWEPIRNHSWERDIGPIDAVIHLAGENLGAHRWTPNVRRQLRDSRIVGTEQLCRHLAALETPPTVLVSASAVGFYGDRGDDILAEDALSGEGFLSELCRDWEAACDPAAEAGIRTVNMRFGMVLASSGGALAKLLPVFKIGAGGRFGSGRQWMSWIGLDDLVAAVLVCLTDSRLAGAVNVVSPNPVTNREFTQSLGTILHRPTVFAAPAFALRIVLGEMADEMLLASARVTPKKLLASGFQFEYDKLDSALQHTILADN